ncbi:Set1 complex component spp1 [Emericellopsis atlantica]|uniref:Set1 complex component spp1 n=1 Tax=Emericellopsis atlantica TaxID=2614577 RepID=A0A9P8CTN0_9HYPO|nr:Set1 complex component spp1 [Emericellopsis atlantica]KAG9259003.1 Set1 complex component spp1 [Emericellopsis atlantica]
MDSTNGEQARFELIDAHVKSENTPAASPQPFIADSTPATDSKSHIVPTPSAEDMVATNGAQPSKKKGTAKVTQKPVKRPKPSGPPKKSAKRVKAEDALAEEGSQAEMEDGSDDDISDDNTYCICKGKDDHRWMICCEKCEDWFHGECINLSKEVGETLIEKFICPRCTTDTFTSLYKKTCGLKGCRKPARLAADGDYSVFCSNEHAQSWWERMVSRLPKSRGKTGLSDELTQDELMALLASGMGTVGEDGMFRPVKTPFQDGVPKLANGDGGNDGDSKEDLSHILTAEETAILQRAERARYSMAQETILCDHMRTLIELAMKRHRLAVKAGRLAKNSCGYDHRLDTVTAPNAFAAFIKTPEGEAILKNKSLSGGVDSDDDDDLRGMCEARPCKAHREWAKILMHGVKCQIREMVRQSAEIDDEERVVRDAAKERWKRKLAENNWVEAIYDDD